MYLTLVLGCVYVCYIFFFQAEDGIRDLTVTGVQTCALPISPSARTCSRRSTCTASRSSAHPRTPWTRSSARGCRTWPSGAISSQRGHHDWSRPLRHACHPARRPHPREEALTGRADPRCPRADRAAQSRRQRLLHRHGRRRARRGARHRAGGRAGPAAGPAPRDPRLHQGSPPHQGCEDDVRIVHLPGPRARRGCAVRPSPEGSRRGHRGEDDDAGVRLEGDRRQPPDRDHAQPLEHEGDDRRLERPRGGGRASEGLRVAFSPDWGGLPVDAEVATVVGQAVRAFDGLGCVVEEVKPGFADTHELIRCMWSTHEAGNYAQYLREWGKRMDPGLVACIEDGLRYSVVDYIEARGQKFAFWDTVRPLFEKYDLLLTPTTSVAAFPVGRLNPASWPQHAWDWLGWASFSYPFNFTGQPAASVPAGFTPAGLPVGLQIVGPRLADLTVLRAAAAVEAARPWGGRRPPLE